VSQLVNELRFEQSLDGTIERPWPRRMRPSVWSATWHDSVAMEVVIHQREEDLKAAEGSGSSFVLA